MKLLILICKAVTLRLAQIFSIALAYIGALTVIAGLWNGDERSFFVAILPAVVVAYLVLRSEEKK